METIAFYSYKGGCGRSLLLASAARFLVAEGKGVVALDLDLRAPGLHYKLNLPFASGGAVPYLIATAEGSELAPPLDDHIMTVPLPGEAGGWLRLMPAGPAPQRGYWIAFKELDEKLILSDPSGKGIMVLLDLQSRIAEDLHPDYLLIDVPSGVTELGGLATTVLADTVVCVFTADQESIDGTLAVVEALESAPRLSSQQQIRVVQFLTRPPEDATPEAQKEFFRKLFPPPTKATRKGVRRATGR